MPMGATITTFNPADKLLPLYPKDAEELPVNLPPSVTLAKGTVLGQVTDSADDVQTLTVTGTPTGGTIPVSLTDPLSGEVVPFSLAFNSTIAQSQAAARAALGRPDVTVTGGTLPGATQVFTFGGSLANTPVPLMTASSGSLTGGTTPAASFAHTTTGRTAGTFRAYANGNSDGSQTALAILAYSVTTDAAGNVTEGGASGSIPAGYSRPYATAYFKGTFRTSELTGLDTNALADPGWSLMSGSVTDGAVRLR